MDNIHELAGSLPENEVQQDLEPSTSYPPCTSPRVAPNVRQRNFAAQAHDDTALFFQILDLGRQYYIWVSAVGPKLGNLHLAIKTPADTAPAVASLLPNSGAVAEGAAMAQRLALKLGLPVVCSCNMPANTPLLQAVAERRLLEELKAMDAERQQQQQEQQRGVMGGEVEAGAAGAVTPEVVAAAPSSAMPMTVA